MLESRRDALKLSVLAALGLSSCKKTPLLLAVTPVEEYNADTILIHAKPDKGNAEGAWVLLQYDKDKQGYIAWTNRLSLTTISSIDRPDLGRATNPKFWQPYADPIPIGTTGAYLQQPVTREEIKKLLSRKTAVTQTAWNEIGKS